MPDQWLQSSWWEERCASFEGGYDFWEPAVNREKKRRATTRATYEPEGRRGGSSRSPPRREPGYSFKDSQQQDRLRSRSPPPRSADKGKVLETDATLRRHWINAAHLHLFSSASRYASARPLNSRPQSRKQVMTSVPTAVAEDGKIPGCLDDLDKKRKENYMSGALGDTAHRFGFHQNDEARQAAIDAALLQWNKRNNTARVTRPTYDPSFCSCCLRLPRPTRPRHLWCARDRTDRPSPSPAASRKEAANILEQRGDPALCWR